MSKRILCFFLGHRYGPQTPADPSWILQSVCVRCRTVKVEMDREAFIPWFAEHAGEEPLVFQGRWTAAMRRFLGR